MELFSTVAACSCIHLYCLLVQPVNIVHTNWIILFIGMSNRKKSKKQVQTLCVRPPTFKTEIARRGAQATQLEVGHASNNHDIVRKCIKMNHQKVCKLVSVRDSVASGRDYTS